MNRPALHPRHLIVLVLFACGVLAASAPLSAQTPDVWTNQKISDMREHQQKVPSQAAEHYEIAQQYLATIDRLSKLDKRSARQQKKLDRAYAKTIDELNATLEAAPDWIEARMALASVYYTQKDYEAARDQYQEILKVDPENERAASYLTTVEYYIRHAEQAADRQEGSGEGGKR